MKVEKKFMPDLKTAVLLFVVWLAMIAKLASAYAAVADEAVAFDAAPSVAQSESYWEIVDELDSLCGEDEKPLPLAVNGPSSRHAHRLIEFDHHDKMSAH